MSWLVEAIDAGRKFIANGVKVDKDDLENHANAYKLAGLSFRADRAYAKRAATRIKESGVSDRGNDFKAIVSELTGEEINFCEYLRFTNPQPLHWWKGKPENALNPWTIPPCVIHREKAVFVFKFILKEVQKSSVYQSGSLSYLRESCEIPIDVLIRMEQIKEQGLIDYVFALAPAEDWINNSDGKNHRVLPPVLPYRRVLIGRILHGQGDGNNADFILDGW